MKHIGEFLASLTVVIVILVIIAVVGAVGTWILGMLPFHGVFRGHGDWKTGALFVAGVVLAGYMAELRGKIKAMESTLEFHAAEIRRLRGDD